MSKSFVYRKGAVIMYHISVLTGRQDEDDFGERLRDVARVEYVLPEMKKNWPTGSKMQMSSSVSPNRYGIPSGRIGRSEIDCRLIDAVG